MIEVADSNAAYYYHYDALGSVIALSDSSGDTVQTYEYSVFGEPAVEDANHTNPYMFAGRRYDIEIGLYYNRARYYNPYTGRFLQADPIGYGDGINMYSYCGSNPLNRTDPSGLFLTDPVKIPLETIWHQSSIGCVVNGRKITGSKDPQHKKDVQEFLDESNFSDEFRGITLTDDVIYSGSMTDGDYYVVFDVPDDVKDYENMTMEIEEEVEGIPILVVKTPFQGGAFGKKTHILDWRLIGMLHDPAYYEGSESKKYLVTGIVGEGVSVVSGAVAVHYYNAGSSVTSAAVLIPGTISIASQAVGVVGFYMVITNPSANVPNFSKWDGYYDYVNGYDVEKGSISERYQKYKKQYNL